MLDDLHYIRKIDKSNMLKTIENFPEQIEEAEKLGKNTHLDIDNIKGIVIGGMGGSGISGDIVNTFLQYKVETPIYVNKDYNLPRWVNEKTLAVIVSYSGNTEESLSMLNEALNKKSTIVGISSGGTLEKLCKEKNLYHIKLPSDFQPRAALAYLLFPMLNVMGEVLKIDLGKEVEDTIVSTKKIREKNRVDIPKGENLSKQIADRLYNKIPQIYGWGIFSPVAKRWRTQLNENSKVIAREDILPECNHNDIVGWSNNKEISKRFACILFRDKDLETKAISKRIEFLKNLLSEVAADVIEVESFGNSDLAKIISTIYLGDFVSCYLAFLRGVDPTPVDIITKLKKELGKI
jgi:glucose/mannose-6-phosphate isomerase